MTLRAIAIISAVVLFVAYRFYGGLLVRLLRLDASTRTPAVDLCDDQDYVPIERNFLLSQHFSAIAAAGPIVGPILAGMMFGWLPALLWILLGAIFVGGVHDITALVASIRHRARSIGEVVREHVSRRSYAFFLLFVWFALAYIIVAFTDITALSFSGVLQLENGQSVSGGGIATSSALYLALPVIMGLLIRFAKLRVGVATIVFLPLVGVSIWLGQRIPIDLASITGLGAADAHTAWTMILLGYCLAASLVPMWLLLQPRGHLGGYFLYFSLAGGLLGLIISGDRATYPAFTDWRAAGGEPLFPMLFIIIACGACSGFHAIVASGTTSKQLRTETDAKLVGYGAMLLEAMVAVVSLACVMRLSQDSPLMTGGANPNFLYAQGIGSFLGALGIPPAYAVAFALMAFTTFVYDTLDVCTRLGRYIVEELTGWRGAAGKTFAALLTVGVPAFFLLYHGSNAAGRVVPAWKLFWELFGASNQLLAALTLLGLTVWLWRTRRALWVIPVLGLPTVVMYVMSTWALVRIVAVELSKNGLGGNPVPWVGMLLVALAALMIVEAGLAFLRPRLGPFGRAPAAARL